MLDIFIGRQPIFDRKLNVTAYELLFRSSEKNSADVIDGDSATYQLLANAFIEIGLDKIIGRHDAFINATRNFIVGAYPLPIPIERVVIEVLEDIEINNELVEALKQLSNKGYRIALDDFVYHESLKPLVKIADLIKIDILALDRPTIIEHVKILRKLGIKKLLAEKVETQDEYDFCETLGFDYFQGYFFAQPKIIKGKKLPTNRLNTIQLIAALQNPETEIQQFTRIISRDVTLSFRLLHYLNSAFFNLPKKVTNIQDAIIYLGQINIKNWATLIALTKIDNKPNELILTTLVRAKMCELLTHKVGQEDESAFLVGLFSSLDALLETPLHEVVSTIPLADHVTSAILNKEGIMGEALQCILTYEHADWDLAKFCDLSPSELTSCYAEAIQWSEETMKAMRGH